MEVSYGASVLKNGGKQYIRVKMEDGTFKFLGGEDLPSFEDIDDNQIWKNALARAASHCSSYEG